MIKLSICIPTYNRALYLKNCLNSIARSNLQSEFEYEICVSNNNSSDETEAVVQAAQKNMNIKYRRNSSNLGIARNFLNVVDMAEGEFAWLLGDDDLLMPNAISDLFKLICNHPSVDFFYVNSYHLHREYLDLFPAPFDTINLPKEMKPFSTWRNAGELNFLELINPKISFDFLGGMFLSVFRKSLWDQNVGVLNSEAISDKRTFSHFDNTFPHVKIFANTYASSMAYFNTKPLSVCLTGVREWSPMYPFIQSVRLVEALDEYRKNGLPYWQYVSCKNFALNNFIPDIVKMYMTKDVSGYAFIKPMKLIGAYCLYPNFYLSFFYFFIRRINRFFNYRHEF